MTEQATLYNTTFLGRIVKNATGQNNQTNLTLVPQRFVPSFSDHSSIIKGYFI
jgi:hypothetical protein